MARDIYAVVDKKYPSEGGILYNLKLYSHGQLVETRKKVGYLAPDKRFVKQVNKEEHYFRKYHGYAIAKVVLLDINKEQCKNVVIMEYRDDEWNRTLIAPLERWEQDGIQHRSEDYEKQIVLPENRMFINRAEEKR